ncbi:MAG TPA: hypothetical protein VM658_07955 [bacterium]|nr:hypothetical protein [bacterium]
MNTAVKTHGHEESFIDEAAIERELAAAFNSGPARAREAIAQAEKLKGLDFADVASLLQCTDPEVTEEMFHAAREANEAI